MQVIVVKESDRSVFIESIVSGKKNVMYVILCDKDIEAEYKRIVDMGFSNGIEDVNKFLEDLVVILDLPTDKAKALKHLDDLTMSKHNKQYKTVFVVANEEFSKEIAVKYNKGENLSEVLL